MKSSMAAVSGKRAVIENDISFIFLKMSMPIHTWNPMARRPAMMLTRACRKKALKLATDAMCEVISIINNTRKGIFSRYAMVISDPSGPAIVAKVQKNIEKMRAVEMPRYRV